MGTIQNVTVRQFRAFMEANGLQYVGTTGGHEKWIKAGMRRPAIIQTHISPIPEHVLRSNLLTMGLTRQDLISFLQNK